MHHTLKCKLQKLLTLTSAYATIHTSLYIWMIKEGKGVIVRYMFMNAKKLKHLLFIKASKSHPEERERDCAPREIIYLLLFPLLFIIYLWNFKAHTIITGTRCMTGWTFLQTIWHCVLCMILQVFFSFFL